MRTRQPILLVFVALPLAFGCGGSRGSPGPAVGADQRVTVARVFNVLDYGAQGNASANDSGALSRAAVAAASEGGTMYMGATGSAYLVSSNLTIPSNVRVHFDPGAVIKPASGVTVTLSMVDALAGQQIFDVSAGGSVSILAEPEISLKWLGAKGDCSTDDTAAAQAWLNTVSGHTNTVAATLLVPPTSRCYKITSTLTLTGRADGTLGFKIRGAGNGINFGSRFRWYGPRGGTLFAGYGWRNSEVEGVTFDGGNIASVAFLLDTDQRTNGSGTSGVRFKDDLFTNVYGPTTSALGGTVTVAPNSTKVSFNGTKQVLSPGTLLTFSSQLGTYYSVTTAVNGTSATLASPYLGTGSSSATAYVAPSALFRIGNTGGGQVDTILWDNSQFIGSGYLSTGYGLDVLVGGNAKNFECDSCGFSYVGRSVHGVPSGYWTFNATTTSGFAFWAYDIAAGSGIVEINSPSVENAHATTGARFLNNGSFTPVGVRGGYVINDVNAGALAGTVSVTNGVSSVRFSNSQSVSRLPVFFSSQPGTYYTLTISGTSGTIAPSYSGSTNTAAFAFTGVRASTSGTTVNFGAAQNLPSGIPIAFSWEPNVYYTLTADCIDRTTCTLNSTPSAGNGYAYMNPQHIMFAGSGVEVAGTTIDGTANNDSETGAIAAFQGAYNVGDANGYATLISRGNIFVGGKADSIAVHDSGFNLALDFTATFDNASNLGIFSEGDRSGANNYGYRQMAEVGATTRQNSRTALTSQNHSQDVKVLYRGEPRIETTCYEIDGGTTITAPNTHITLGVIQAWQKVDSVLAKVMSAFDSGITASIGTSTSPANEFLNSFNVATAATYGTKTTDLGSYLTSGAAYFAQGGDWTAFDKGSENLYVYFQGHGAITRGVLDVCVTTEMLKP